MKKLRLPLLFVLVLACACERKPPVRDSVTAEFESDGSVTLTQVTELDLRAATPAARARVGAARDAALAGTDEWSARFARIAPALDRTVFERRRGELERVERSAVVSPDDVQRFFADSSLTFHVTNGDGWRELAIYPGTPMRASREQREHFAKSLDDWSRAVADYYDALDHLYSYLNRNPERAQYVFAALLDQSQPDNLPTAVTEDEAPLVRPVIDSMIAIVDRLHDDENYPVDEEADLVLNPFPAKLTLQFPGDIVASEGFRKSGAREVVVDPVDLFGALKSLEGKWATPDPLVTILREEEVDARAMASLVRHSTSVLPPSEIAETLRAKIVRPSSYLVRWRG